MKLKITFCVLVGLWVLGMYSVCFWRPEISWAILGVELVAMIISWFWFRNK